MLTGSLEWLTALNSKQTPRWITFLGNSGTGKTYLAKTLFSLAVKRLGTAATNYIVRSCYWPDFVQRLRDGTAYGERNDMKLWPVLLLDDIGAERDVSGFATEELNTLLGCRMGKWTILTANLEFDRVTQLDQRIASRMYRDGNICLEIKTEDFSLRQLSK
jgi:DNA replication protein DnaC